GGAETFWIDHRHLALVVGGIEEARVRGMPERVARQPVCAQEFGIDDRRMVAAGIDALVAGGRLGVVVHQPHAGPGVWLMHDHAQPAASNKGINPGGDHTAIVYSEFLGADGLPRDALGHATHARFFDPAYYQRKVPVVDPKRFRPA